MATRHAHYSADWAGIDAAEPEPRIDPRRIQRAPRDVRWDRAAAWRDASAAQLAGIGRGGDR